MGKISDFMNSLNPDTFNCVFSTNGMTLLTDEQYNYRLEEIHKLKQEKYNLQQERDKYKSIVEKTIDKIEQLRFEKWSIMGTDIMDLLDILDGKELEEGNSNE